MEAEAEDMMNLKAEMSRSFKSFQDQFHRLDKERQDMEERIKKDREFSNYVFNTITQKKGDNFHNILQGSNPSVKKRLLGL